MGRTDSAWKFLSDVLPLKPAMCVSLGFVVHDGPNSITLIPHLSEPNGEKDYAGFGELSIPTTWIMERYVITIPDNLFKRRT